MSNLRFGTIVALMVILIFLVVHGVFAPPATSREGFVSQEAMQVASQAQEVFDRKGGDVTYKEYRASVQGSDPVQFHRVRALARKGELTPSAVQDVL